MDIPYTVVECTPVDEDHSRVVVETQLPVVVNGYGGGRLTFVVANASLQNEIEEKVAWKFTQQVTTPDGSVFPIHNFFGNLEKARVVLDREEAKRDAERHRIEAEVRAAAETQADQGGSEKVADLADAGASEFEVADEITSDAVSAEA